VSLPPRDILLAYKLLFMTNMYCGNVAEFHHDKKEKKKPTVFLYDREVVVLNSMP